VTTSGWVLVLDPAQGGGDPGRRVAGLSLALRLALTAQSGGATEVRLAPGADGLAPLLVDPRLQIPVRAPDAASSGEPAVRVPANLVVHRGLFGAMRDAGLAGERRIPDEPFTFAPPFGFAPMLVTDAKSASVAERALLRSLRKPQDGWTSTYLNRHISLAITRLLVKTPLRPNQVSIAILAVGLAGAWLASAGTYGAMLAGAALFQAQSVLDGCDGEMSRVTFRGSLAGQWLDTVGDDLTNYGFFAGTGVGLWRASGSPLWLALAAVVVGCGLVGSALEYRYLVRIGSGDLLQYPLGVGKAPGGGGEKTGLALVFDAIQPLFKRDTFVFLTLVGAGLGLLGPFLAIFAAGAIGVLAAILKAEARMARERRAAG
jgi:phosphatidylglycerophosphate synthase